MISKKKKIQKKKKLVFEISFNLIYLFMFGYTCLAMV
jgi:hypothetical protein